MVDLSQYKALFLEEARGYIQQLNTLLLDLEKSSEDEKILNGLMAVGHTFKGISATMGYNHLASLGHALEDIFDLARKKKLTIAKNMFVVFFQAVDAMEAAVKKVDIENSDEIDEEAVKSLRSIAEGKYAAEELKKEDGGSGGDNGKKSEISSGEKPSETETISRIGVEVERLDMLMNLIEELTVERLRISHLSSPENSSSANDVFNGELRSISRRLDRIVSDLQYNISRARMVPLEYIFLRFPRLVRDTAKRLGKEVSLEISGAQVELDRAIVEMLSEPLVHLIKNSIDHGIESQEKRAAANKSKSGTISISAVQERGMVKMIIKDDGGGIDWEEVAKVALSKGLISQNQAEEWINIFNNRGFPPKDLAGILYRADFSIKKDITEISGRGVGLSVVKEKIDRIGGRVDIKTEVGKGTSFILEIPSTLSLTNALLIQVGEELFAVPFSAIIRSVLVQANSVKSFSDGDVAIVDGQELPLLWMRKFFKLSTLGSVHTVVIVGRDSLRAGLVIDRIVSEQEVVVKPFSSVLKTIPGFSGATILGDGRVALVVDVASLLDQTSLYGRAA